VELALARGATGELVLLCEEVCPLSGTGATRSRRAISSRRLERTVIPPRTLQTPLC
jgi:hypothetical protein